MSETCRVLYHINLRNSASRWLSLYGGADKSLARPGRKQATATEDFEFYILFIIIIVGILELYIYIYKTSIKQNILRGADKSLARPGRKQATATEDFEFYISYL